MQPCQSENVFGGDIQNGGYLVHKYEKSDAFTGKSENGTPLVTLTALAPLPWDRQDSAIMLLISISDKAYTKVQIP